MIKLHGMKNINVNIRFPQIITVCHLKTLRDIEKLKNIFEFSEKNYVRNTKKFTCDKNCVYQCYLCKVWKEM
jgi:hypothetical protein